MEGKARARVFYYRHEAELAQSALEAQGIECSITSDDAGGQGIGIQFTNGVILWVKASDLERARKILGAIDIPASDGV